MRGPPYKRLRSPQRATPFCRVQLKKKKKLPDKPTAKRLLHSRFPSSPKKTPPPATTKTNRNNQTNLRVSELSLSAILKRHSCEFLLRSPRASGTTRSARFQVCRILSSPLSFFVFFVRPWNEIFSDSSLFAGVHGGRIRHLLTVSVQGRPFFMESSEKSRASSSFPFDFSDLKKSRL